MLQKSVAHFSLRKLGRFTIRRFAKTGHFSTFLNRKSSATKSTDGSGFKVDRQRVANRALSLVWKKLVWWHQMAHYCAQLCYAFGVELFPWFMGPERKNGGDIRPTGLKSMEFSCKQRDKAGICGLKKCMDGLKSILNGLCILIDWRTLKDHDLSMLIPCCALVIILDSFGRQSIKEVRKQVLLKWLPQIGV